MDTIYSIFVQVAAMLGAVVVPPQEKEGFRRWLKTLSGWVTPLVVWTPPKWDDRALEIFDSAVANDKIYDIIWFAVDGVFFNGGDETEVMASAQGQLVAMGIQEVGAGEVGFGVLEIMALIQAIIAILKQFFNK